MIADQRSREAMIKHAAKSLVAGKRVKLFVRIDAGDEYWFSAQVAELHPQQQVV